MLFDCHIGIDYSGAQTPTSRLAALLSVLQLVTFPLRLQDMATVRESVEGGSGERFTPQNFRPVLERQIRGDDEAVPLVRRGDHVEEQFGPRLADGKSGGRSTPVAPEPQ